MVKKAVTKKPKTPEFLIDLLNARSPSGYEQEAQAVIDKYVKPSADVYEKDTMGNRFATLNPKGNPVVMFAGHMDELGLMVHYIDDKGFVYFNTIGGHDLSIISGRRVQILTKNGTIHGVTGKRAIHLMTPEDRKKVPQRHEIWIDVGAQDKKEAESLVEIGDPIVYDHGFQILRKCRATARAFDDKAGCFVVCETLRRLAQEKTKLQAKIVSVATTQEEVGTRGAILSGYSVNPDIAVAVDVGHATDSPDCDKRQFGEFYLGKGPIICRGANINPFVFERLVAVAKANKIPYQVEAEPGPTGTDARSIQISRQGVATGLVSIPLRYMHTPSEVVDLEDVENAIKLLVAFSKSIKKTDTGIW
ncbi:MAG: peptidase M42 [Verrucomicrobia bacterium CG_4_10_14_3_um_filter_43_23]|nr:MAG: peptidase M42 [Verrucomicrobia bacterium CG1_02_43_26]PIP59637.1 MAG: peptidase M42 [Verrucomicrobia bacterium CG22_combo_CG10-13_8_21_14_all_43_17]PIX58936.1 MAG: peptidase M42 [Verrucomicrobia bacterium CG_4_10_14_3_um_filter_43_23]PIY63081.1 MAG: peptidase M42 [Verrucomicrobia bacterium CG_4_10_14_0_8_um_filter_43_34]PJA43588.1 MAG: peptidase M42 [Verrucomicrobia bacterium CG_4_9_14_3_um_filter_43_20]